MQIKFFAKEEENCLASRFFKIYIVGLFSLRTDKDKEYLGKIRKGVIFVFNHLVSNDPNKSLN